MSQIVDEIRDLEVKVGADRAKAIRGTIGLPAVDGAPASWLERYRDELRAAVPNPSVNRQADLDQWWAEQAARKPRAWQVWTGRTRPTELVHSTDSVEEACERARQLARPAPKGKCTIEEGRRSWVLSSSNLLAKPALTVTTKGNERGDLAKPKPPPKAWTKLLEQAEALRTAPDWTPIRKLGIGSRRAHDLVDMLRNGHIWWGKKRSLDVKPARLRLERTKLPGEKRAQLVVRR